MRSLIGLAVTSTLLGCGHRHTSNDMLVIPPGKTTKQDAIAVRLDHRDAYSVVVIFPYAIGPAGDVAIEAPYALKGDKKIFSR